MITNKHFEEKYVSLIWTTDKCYTTGGILGYRYMGPLIQAKVIFSIESHKYSLQVIKGTNNCTWKVLGSFDSLEEAKTQAKCYQLELLTKLTIEALRDMTHAYNTSQERLVKFDLLVKRPVKRRLDDSPLN